MENQTSQANNQLSQNQQSQNQQSQNVKSWSLRELSKQSADFQLPPLPYAFDALEPTIDTKTIQIHHGKHHKTYVENLNKFLKEVDSELASAPLEQIFRNINSYPVSVRNNGGGHFNHSFFWSIMTSDKDSQAMPSRLQREIESTFESVEAFKEQFEKAGVGQFGSGWVWLIRTKDGQLKITSTKNQDNPLMQQAEVSGYPILGVDVWEHAYYLKHQEKRAAYLKEIWSVINWKQVNAYDVEVLEQLATYQ